MPKDIDEEILGLIGGSSKQKKRGKSRRKRDYSSDDSSSSSSSSESEEEIRRKSSTVKRPPKKRGKVSSDEESDDDKFDDGFDKDLYGDEEDRRRLFSLPELQREEILSERAEKRKELRERYEIKRSLKNKSPKGKSVDSSSSKSTSRRSQTKVSGKAASLNDLKRRIQPSERRRYESSSSSDEEEKDEDYRKGNRSDDSDQEVRKDRRRGDRRSRFDDGDSEENATTLEGIITITLRREFLEKKMNEPYFDSKVSGFFVRVGIGKKSDDTPAYKIAEIGGVKDTGKSYQIGNKTTSKYLILKLGDSSRTFPMDVISNTPPTADEFKIWISDVGRNGHRPITQEEAKERAARLKEFNDYVYTEEDVNKIIEENKKKFQVINYTAEKVRINTLLASAQDANDVESIAKLTQQIKEISQKEEESRKRTKTRDKVGSINQRNTQQNLSIDKGIEEQNGDSAKTDLDPFSRRKSKASAVRPQTKGAEPEEKIQAAEKPPILQVIKKEKVKEPTRAVLDPATILLSAHKFDFEELKIESLLPPFEKMKPYDEGPQNRKTISLLEYQKRRGIL